MKDAEWFASWFDSPYYPVLYQHRSYLEAEAFVELLIAHLAPDADARFLDLACGRGRHSVNIHQMGYRVTGLDLSPQSIADARQQARAGLDFGVHDMRDPLPGSYSHILNLFTSFGYFSDPSENKQVLRNVSKALEPDGTFVMDFLNRDWVIARLVAEEEQVLDGIRFEIRRSVQDGFIVKDIHIHDQGQPSHFQERVQAFGREEIEEMMAEAGLTAYEAWGDYGGGEWTAQDSPRLILFARHDSNGLP